LAELEDVYLNQVRKKWLNSGVMMHNPATVFIGDDVVLDSDVEIGQGCVLKGHCTVDSGVVLGPNCYLENAVISNDSILPGHNIIIDSFIKEHEILEFGSRVIEEEDYE
jgi:bifunctional UDP-N-acetylglucosamine pyrophosphorylase / glucosamine-1-phosphate N-acetyltransferase